MVSKSPDSFFGYIYRHCDKRQTTVLKLELFQFCLEKGTTSTKLMRSDTRALTLFNLDLDV